MIPVHNHVCVGGHLEWVVYDLGEFACQFWIWRDTNIDRGIKFRSSIGLIERKCSICNQDAIVVGGPITPAISINDMEWDWIVDNPMAAIMRAQL